MYKRSCARVCDGKGDSSVGTKVFVCVCGGGGDSHFVVSMGLSLM